MFDLERAAIQDQCVWILRLTAHLFVVMILAMMKGGRRVTCTIILENVDLSNKKSIYELEEENRVINAVQRFTIVCIQLDPIISIGRS